MVNEELSISYIKRAKIRFRLINQFMDENDYADVIRESQEIVELIQKALLIKIGIEPPKWHDVIDIILENQSRFPEEVKEELKRLRRGSKWLRSQRELAFYGDMDFIPEKSYTLDDAEEAIDTVKGFLEIAKKVIKE